MNFIDSVQARHERLRVGFDEKALVRKLEYGGLHLIGSIVAENPAQAPDGTFRSYHSRELDQPRETSPMLVYACESGSDAALFTDYLCADGDTAVFAVQRPFDVGVRDFTPRFVRDFQFHLGSIYSVFGGGRLSIHAVARRISERKEICEYFGEIKDLVVLDGTPMTLDEARHAVEDNMRRAREWAIHKPRATAAA